MIHYPTSTNDHHSHAYYIKHNTSYEKGLMYHIMMLAHHLPKTMLIGCDELC
jgi:hypothetical protein